MALPPGSDLAISVVDIFRSPILIAMWKLRSAPVPVGVAAVKMEVEVESVYRWLAEEDDESAVGVGVHNRIKLSNTHSPSLRYTCQPKLCVRRADVRVDRSR
jgi:hypothetical protein